MSSLKVLFAGTPEFSLSALRAIHESAHEVLAVLTQPDRPAGRGRKLRPGPVKEYAQQQGLMVLQPQTLRDEAVQQQLREFNADVMVVVAYGLILPPAVLETPRLGCLNIHASLLPRWRGAAPIQRAILAGDTETGITIMQMDEGLDTGDMLLLERCPINADDTAAVLHDRLADMGGRMIVMALDQLDEGKLKPEKQDDSKACYAEKLQKSEAVIDWSDPADAILRRINAFNPWPVAQTVLDEKVMRIWAAAAVPGDDRYQQAAAGDVVHWDKEGFSVKTGAGLLRVTELQMPGSKRMSAAAFMNAHNLAGKRLGTVSESNQ